MGKLEWNESLAFGIESLDAQHKELIRIANVLLKSVRRQQSAFIVKNVLRRLREYTVFHFNAEEAFMEEIRYPARGEHAQLHAGLKQQVKEYQYRLYQQEVLSDTLVLTFLKKWLMSHIIEEDMKVAAFLREKGRTAKHQPESEG